MAFSSEPKGEYEELGEYTFWEGNREEHCEEGYMLDQLKTRIYKWIEFNPSGNQFKREQTGQTTKISLESYKVHKLS